MKTKEDILELIENEGVEFIRLQFTDMFGSLKNLAVTPGQMERVLANKYLIRDSVIFNDEFSIGEDLVLYPDLDTFVILPWRPQQGKVGKFLCDIHHQDGTLYDMSSRTILKKVIDEATKKGYDFYVDPETEFFLFETDDNGIPTTVTHEAAGFMDVGPIDFGENARRDMVLMLEEMGFEVESSHHEKAPGQHEIAFKEAGALAIADSLMTFRFAVRSIAKRFGQYATFMPKPITDKAGSGMAFNISIYKNDRSILGGNDISDEARFFMGGIMAHAEGICAITNPIVNSYKRIISGFDAPGDISWSSGRNNTLVRTHSSFGERKIELRFPDPAANPYLSLAVCLAAGIDGIENKIDPGKEKCELKKAPKLLPDNLKEAVTSLKKDKFITKILGEQFTDIYSEAKMKEWKQYMYEVSDWEINKYLTKM